MVDKAKAFRMAEMLLAAHMLTKQDKPREVVPEIEKTLSREEKHKAKMARKKQQRIKP